MRKEEAEWINKAIQKHLLSNNVETNLTALNLGCGTKTSREKSKPYIHKLTIAPLLENSYKVIHSDIIQADGVDLCGDIFEPDFINKLTSLKPDLIFFCNIFEHLPNENREKIPLILDQILKSNGHILITTPKSYPYHADPIDTMYRPKAIELSNLFPGYEILESSEVSCGSYLDEIKSAPKIRILKKILRLLIPFVRPKRWLSHAHRFTWIFRDYQISCVLLKKQI